LPQRGQRGDIAAPDTPCKYVSADRQCGHARDDAVGMDTSSGSPEARGAHGNSQAHRLRFRTLDRFGSHVNGMAPKIGGGGAALDERRGKI